MREESEPDAGGNVVVHEQENTRHLCQTRANGTRQSKDAAIDQSSENSPLLDPVVAMSFRSVNDVRTIAMDASFV